MKKHLPPDRWLKEHKSARPKKNTSRRTGGLKRHFISCQNKMGTLRRTGGLKIEKVVDAVEKTLPAGQVA